MVARMSNGGPASIRPEGDILDDVYRVREKKPEFGPEYHAGTVTQNFGAGHDTVCAVMTAAVALSCADTEARSRIHQELGAVSDNNDVTRFDRAKDLEYTQACLKESQRLYPVTAMSLMRRVPKSGLELHGHYFPPGTTVGCNPVSYHQNEAVFGRGADAFDPDRWLGDPERRRALDHAVLTWGGANRRCPGQHLAQLICYKAFTRLMKEFDIEVSLPTDDEMPSYFLSMMTGVKARFRPRS
jgi:cytochrome P450